ncbi:MAG: anthranilate synthase component I family protein [Chitinophagaceae bacterium]
MKYTLTNATPTNCIFPINDFEQVKKKVLNWSRKFNTFCFLDNHQYQLEPHSMECLLAAGKKRSIVANAGHALDQLQEFMKSSTGWLFGHLGYDLKNEIEKLSSAHPTGINFPDLFFFEPEILVRLSETSLTIEAEEPQLIYDAITREPVTSPPFIQEVNIENRTSRDDYISSTNKLRQHILRGDCYEINFCQEFFAKNARIDPVHIYSELGRISPNPFSALYRMEDQWLICASPERFLKKESTKILSQPIKGTSKRVTGDTNSDAASKQELFNSSKDRSENVMVVDLVRNDLSRICREGTVQVEELFGVYSFPQVHQMVSTVSGELKEAISFTEIIRATFPMGSMTGAPKKRVMELIEQYEQTKRGIFSGALGYITPGGDFDFNVVIRSIMYNAENNYLSFQAGSGITFYSDAEKEWEECMMKAAAMKKVLEEK